MAHENLRQLLAQLHARLTQTRTLDADARERLTTVMHDIEKALGRGGADATPHKPHLESLAVRFEAEHPALADALRQLVDALGKAGI